MNRRGAAVVDVGFGRGSTGPRARSPSAGSRDVSLVEPLAKRVSFLRTVLGHFRALPNGAGTLRVVRGKGEDLAARGEVFDTAVARATLPPGDWLDLGGRLVRSDGAVWVLLARETAPEVEGWKIETEEQYTWPLTGVERRALSYRRADLAEAFAGSATSSSHAAPVIGEVARPTDCARRFFVGEGRIVLPRKCASSQFSLRRDAIQWLSARLVDAHSRREMVLPVVVRRRFGAERL